jgi:esterase/lipase
LFDAFLKQNIAVLTIDPPGHGDFQIVPMTVANGRAAVLQALDWLSSQSGVNQVAGCGISFGGNLIADVGAIDARLRCLVTISAPVDLAPVTRSTFALEMLGLFIWPRNIGLLREGSLLTLWCEYKTLKGAWFGEPLVEMIKSLDTMAAFGNMGARPKLIVHGTRDKAVPHSNAIRLYENSSGVREIALISQATHVSPVLYRAEMDQVAATIKRWLDYNRLNAQ